MIVFTKLKVQNFLSVGNSPIEINLNSHKITSITGENGSAKSSLCIDAPYYALFGKSYRNIPLPKMINSINKKGMLVEIEFIANQNYYKVVRGKKPDIFEIYVNNNLVPQMANVRDYQKYLEEHILKVDDKSFKQIVFVGSAGYNPFMMLTPQERRGVIEKIFNLDIFTAMNVEVKNKISENKLAYLNCKNELDIFKAKIEMQKKSDTDKINQLNRDIEELDNNIEKCNNEIKKLEQQRDLEISSFDMEKEKEEFNKLKKELESYNDSKKTFVSKKTEYNYEIKRYDKLIKFYKDNSDCKCPTCKNDITKEFANEQISLNQAEYNKFDEKVRNIDNLMVNLENAIKKCTDAGNDIGRKVDAYKRKIESYNNDIRFQNNLIANSNSTKKRKQAEIVSCQSTESDDLQKIKEEYVAKQKEFYSITIDNVSLNFIAEQLKDDGVKSTIISRYIPIINSFISRYLEIIGFNIGFTIDENFKEHITAKNKENFEYCNLSEGEKKRIDLAIMFAFREFSKIQSSTSTNLLILDEYDGGVLDDDGETAILSILQSSSDSNVFIISHSTDSFSNISDRTLIAKKENGFATIKEM